MSSRGSIPWLAEGASPASGIEFLGVNANGQPYFHPPTGPLLYGVGDSTVSISVAGNTDYSLTMQSFLAYRTFVLTGVLTGNINFIVPSTVPRDFTVVNQTTGAYTITVKHQTTLGAIVSQGWTGKYWTDGTTVSSMQTNAGLMDGSNHYASLPTLSANDTLATLGGAQQFTAPVKLKGVTDGSSATAGNLDEQIIAVSGSTNITPPGTVMISSVTITKGRWRIFFGVDVPAAPNTWTNVQVGTGSVNGSITGTRAVDFFDCPIAVIGTYIIGSGMWSKRVNFFNDTPYYFNVGVSGTTLGTFYWNWWVERVS